GRAAGEARLVSAAARLRLRTYGDRVAGASGPSARNNDETRAGPLSRRRDAAMGPLSPATRRARPGKAAGQRRLSSTARQGWSPPRSLRGGLSRPRAITVRSQTEPRGRVGARAAGG